MIRLSKKDINCLNGLSVRLHGLLFSLTVFDTGSIYGSAVVVPKKIEKTAVKRNLLRRRVMYVLREFGNMPKFAMIFYAKKTVSNAVFEEIKTDVNNLLARVTNTR